MAKLSMARIRKGMTPGPVYEAHFKDGTVMRMTFWQQEGKPWDFERGRDLCASIARKPMSDGYVFVGDKADHVPFQVIADPIFPGTFYRNATAGVETKQAKRRTAKQYREALAALVDLVPPCAAREQARELFAA